MAKLKVTGKVVSGIKKGAFYVSLPIYMKFFEKLLGNVPYPGTLNIRLDEKIDFKKILRQKFEPSNKNFSPVLYAFGELLGKKVLVIKPIRTVHDGYVLELVSDEKLRDKFNLEDGMKVELLIDTAEED